MLLPFKCRAFPPFPLKGSSESSLVNYAAHLDAFGMHQPWSPTITLASQSSTAVGSLPLNASTKSTSPPVASQLNPLPGMSSLLVVPPFVSVSSSASLPFSAPCSSTVYSLPTTITRFLSTRTHTFLSYYEHCFDWFLSFMLYFLCVVFIVVDAFAGVLKMPRVSNAFRNYR